MIEKFSDYEGGFLNCEGEFIFEIKEAEIKQSKKGDDMVELQANVHKVLQLLGIVFCRKQDGLIIT